MNKRLFVAGLPFAATEEEIKDLFSQIGTVVSVTIITDKFTNRSKGFGFVEMDTPEEAEKAIKTLHDTDFGGRKLVVAEAKPMEKREFAPREHSSGGRGGYSSRGGSGRGHGSGDDRRGGYSR